MAGLKETRIIMGMPVTVEIVDDAAKTGRASAHGRATKKDIHAVFDYFRYIDEKFSTYKPESEIMRINRGELAEKEWSDDMAIIFALAEDTKRRTDGFFDIRKPDGHAHEPHAGASDSPLYDPSGIVKGWAIFQAAKILEACGFENFYIDAGGDIQANGVNAEGNAWSVGIRNPFFENIVKIIYVPKAGAGIATSGTYIRGEHIYNPKSGAPANEIASLTVVGSNIYEADRFATAAFAMGAAGIHFIEKLPGLEGYMIDTEGIATMTTGFEKYLHQRQP